MKKLIFCLTLMIIGLTATGCGSCQSENNKQGSGVMAQADYDGVAQDFTSGVANIVALHKQTMFSMIKGEYEWRNLQVLFNETINAETLDDLHVIDITDVFYYWKDGPWIQFITSNVDKGMLISARIPDVWVEDCNMNDAEIRLWPEDVLNLLKEWNGIIPQSNGMILRMPLGPRDCNAQWVIGGISDVIFIDAVTGDITNWCPAFPH